MPKVKDCDEHGTIHPLYGVACSSSSVHPEPRDYERQPVRTLARVLSKGVPQLLYTHESVAHKRFPNTLHEYEILHGRVASKLKRLTQFSLENSADKKYESITTSITALRSKWTELNGDYKKVKLSDKSLENISTFLSRLRIISRKAQRILDIYIGKGHTVGGPLSEIGGPLSETSAAMRALQSVPVDPDEEVHDAHERRETELDNHRRKMADPDVPESKSKLLESTIQEEYSNCIEQLEELQRECNAKMVPLTKLNLTCKTGYTIDDIGDGCHIVKQIVSSWVDSAPRFEKSIQKLKVNLLEFDTYSEQKQQDNLTEIHEIIEKVHADLKEINKITDRFSHHIKKANTTKVKASRGQLKHKSRRKSRQTR